MAQALEYLQNKLLENGLNLKKEWYNNKLALYNPEQGYYLMERDYAKGSAEIRYKLIIGGIEVRFGQSDFNNFPKTGDYYTALSAAIIKITTVFVNIKL